MPDVGSSEPASATESAAPAEAAPPTQFSPIIGADYRLLATGKEEDFKKFAETANEATTKLGFMLLENPPVSKAEIDKHFWWMKRFFAEATIEEKQSIPEYMVGCCRRFHPIRPRTAAFQYL
jgi:isopenicillin N synthase-like dioxygenase